MKIYTKTGDDGTTGLFSGERVPKYSLRVDTYGTIDELNAYIGLITTLEIDKRLKEPLEKLNNLLFMAGSDLATPLDSDRKYKIDRIKNEHTRWLEEKIDDYTEELPPLKSFILPGGTMAAGMLHVARTVCRRAERLLVRLSNEEKVSGELLVFMNRLSDFLFTAARMANFIDGKEDIKRQVFYE